MGSMGIKDEGFKYDDCSGFAAFDEHRHCHRL